jgi:DNA-binding GntR family transcriptional regulator
LAIESGDLGETLQSGVAFSLDRKRPAAQQVYENLRERIVTLELKPGVSLSRQAVADFYTVSQTPVREALLRLEEEGLVEVYPQSKTLVARIDLAQARQTQFLRTAIELEVAHALIQGSSQRVLVLARRTLEDQERAHESGDLRLFDRLDREFHLTLCSAVGQSALWELVMSRSGHIDRLRKLDLPNPGKTTRVLREHAAILDSIAGADETAVTAAVRRHLSGTLATVDSIGAAYPDYFQAGALS